MDAPQTIEAVALFVLAGLVGFAFVGWTLRVLGLDEEK